MDRGRDLTILVPVWRRTVNIARVYGSAQLATPDAEVLFIASSHDRRVLDVLSSFELLVDSTLIVDGVGGEQGDYARKINAGYRRSTRPVLFLGADDLDFHPGWYDAARPLLREPVGVVGTVDDCNERTVAGIHSTHSLVARWYADRGACMDEDHVIYHEGYWHEYCDDELVRTAMHRDAYVHAFGAHVEHVHMLKNAALDDDVYRHGRSMTAQSRMLFRRRRPLWGDATGSALRQKAARPRVVRR